MPMTLYNANLSPYASRTRLQIRAKGIESQFALTERPDVDLYRTLTPTARMPALDIGGFVLPESETIAEYIEDAFPEPSLRGKDAVARAKVRLFARFVDIYIAPAFNLLFPQVAAKPRDEAKVEEGLTKLREGLGYIEHYLPDGERYAVENRLTLADCALVPAFFFCNVIPTVFGQAPFAGQEKAKRYYDRIVAEDAECARLAGEIGAALVAWQKAQR
jgi:glutathione S-transferase